MIKKVFLDLGTNLGQGLRQFDNKFNLLNNPEWKIFCFEPNNDIDLKSLFPNVNNIEYYNKAIWIDDTILKFRKQGHHHNKLTGLGSKIESVEKKYNPSNCFYKIENVEAINFSNFLLNLKSKYPNASIYIKMDIEGTEFEVIDHLIKNGSINLIEELYCECHGRFRFPLEIQKNEKIKKKIFELENSLKDKVEKCGVKFYFWH